MRIFHKSANSKDYVIVIVLILMPLLFYIPDFLTEDQLNSSVIGFEYDLDTVLWIFLVKFRALLLLFVWSISCKHWWRIAIIIPLAVEFFKFLGFFNISVSSFDEVDYLYAIPITIPITLSIIYLSRKLNHFFNYQIIYDKLNNEINVVFEEIHAVDLDEEKFKKEFEFLKKVEYKYSKKEYLEKLIDLRNKFYLNERK